MLSRAPFLGAIVGPGRSGTTLAGVLIDSSPDVIYRFEPFHRLSAVKPEFRRWFALLKNQGVREHDVDKIYSLLIAANPRTNKPPFFGDKRYALRRAGRRQLWPVARAMPMFQGVYESLYSPQAGPPLIFKEVTFVKPLRNLLEHTSIPIVYVVRHPCATVLSDIKGQTSGKMPSSRQLNLREIVDDLAPHLAQRFADVVSSSNIVARTALLWRCEVEACIDAMRNSGKGLVLTYEQLADDAWSQAQRMCGHFGLEFASEMRQFIDFLYGMEGRVDSRLRRTGWGNKYFSVYRNPRSQKDAWKSQISADDRKTVESIVEDSHAVAYCARLGNW
jgi:hypothetical protein